VVERLPSKHKALGSVPSSEKKKKEKKGRVKPGMVVHAFNPSTWEAKAGLCELEASLVYIESFRS